LCGQTYVLVCERAMRICWKCGEPYQTYGYTCAECRHKSFVPYSKCDTLFFDTLLKEAAANKERGKEDPEVDKVAELQPSPLLPGRALASVMPALVSSPQLPKRALASAMPALVVKKNWLEALRAKAEEKSSPNDQFEVDLVADDVDQHFHAGEAYRAAHVDHLLAFIDWLPEVLDKKSVKAIGKVWHSCDWGLRIDDWFIFELSRCVYKIHWRTYGLIPGMESQSRGEM